MAAESTRDSAEPAVRPGGTVVVTGAGARRLRTTRHPWIYRDHVAGVRQGGAQPENGDVVAVSDPEGRPLGAAVWSSGSKIALRMLSHGPLAPLPDEEAMRARFLAAVGRRAPLAAVTDAVRLVASEADGIPGLVADRYADVVVVQSTTAFADRLLPALVRWLAEVAAPRMILARNDAAARDLEGLERHVRLLAGDEVAEVDVREGDVAFRVRLRDGQKTGLFLDQRANRLAVGRMVPDGARVLDVFSYCGGFALHAARRAAAVVAVEESARAVECLAANAARNGMANVEVRRENAFHALRELERSGATFDAVVLDPPAFAKSRRERDAALRGYREINARALRCVAPGGLFVTASCSYQVDEATFEEMVRGAAADAERDVIVLERRGQDIDHPVLLALPESRYLKCLITRVG